MSTESAGERSSDLRRASGAAGWQLVAKIGVSALAILSSAILFRSLGEEGFGTLTLVQNLLVFASIGMAAGLAPAQSRFVPEIERHVGGLRSFAGRCLRVQGIAWLVISAVALMLDPLLAGWFDLEPGIVAAGALLLSGSIVFETLTATFTARLALRELAIVQIAAKASALAAIVIWVARGGGVLGVLAIYAVVHALAALFLWRRLPSGEPRSAPASGIAARRLLTFGLPVAGAMLVNQVVLRQSETLVLGLYHPKAWVGFYGAAYGLAQRVMEFVPAALWPIVLSLVSARFLADRGALARDLSRYWRVLFLLILPLAAFGLTYFETVFEWVYGAGAGGASLCPWFFLVFVLSFCTQPVGMASYVLERPGINLRVAGLGALTNLSLDFLLIPRFGMEGALVAVSGTFVVTNLAMVWLGRKLLPELRFPTRYVLRVLTGLLPALLLMPWLRGLEHPAAVLAGMLMTAGLMYSGLHLMSAFEPLPRWERLPLPPVLRRRRSEPERP